ncbi:MAG: fibronectin type III domain-containing protein [Verrucomicrobiota bacterium]
MLFSFPLTTNRVHMPWSDSPRVVLFVRILAEVFLLGLLLHTFQALGIALPETHGVNLAWERSPGLEVTGYHVYYGILSGHYSNDQLVGNVTSCTISGLVSGVTYFFAISAYDETGTESDLSNELSYTVPLEGPPVLSFLRFDQGQAVWNLTGQPGHTYQVQALRRSVLPENLATVTLNETGSAVVVDANSLIYPFSSYRIAEIFPPELTMKRPGPGACILTVKGQAGRVYDIEVSQDLAVWKPISTVRMEGSDSISFTDKNAGNFPKRFYRVRDTNN